MSHFTVLVIGENPEEQLQPFNENIDVPRYCKKTKSELIEDERKSIKRYAETTYAEYLRDPEKYAEGVRNDKHLDYLKNDFPKKLTWNDEQLYTEAIRWEEAENIGPDGEVYSTYNPKSKWDWYALGGRWAGLIEVKEGVTYDAPKFSWGWSEKEQVEVLAKPLTDSARVKDIANLSEIRTFAILKNGEWYERGEMGWWGAVSNEKDEQAWDQEFTKLLMGLPEDTLLSVYDCHI